MRPTPFRAVPPRSGRQWTVVDADGKEVCECDGLEDGRAEAELLVRSVNGARLVQQAVALERSANEVWKPVLGSPNGCRIAEVLSVLRVRILRRARAL